MKINGTQDTLGQTLMELNTNIRQESLEGKA